jgi:glutamate formiminotransferase/formiminotetrahydrofolate cyclodeaminase
MKRLVCCVPNFSEGTDTAAIEAICQAVQSTGVRIVSVEPDADYNRTVLTFVAEPELACEGAFAAIQASAEHIDMRNHKGGHPRMGACDVTPFVPVAGVTLDQCAELARTVGRRVGQELNLPVYLYGAAGAPGKQDLAVVRKGQYEGLAKKIVDPNWKPDFGPAEFNPKFGAALVGARPFLIAYNVNLASDDLDAANQIAKRVRTSGQIIDGVRVPGSLLAVKGLGVLLKEKNIVQVSMNLVDYKITNMNDAYDEVVTIAQELGQIVTGSEICGIVPMDALAKAGRSYAGQGMPDKQAADHAITHLGLDDLAAFDPYEKVLEWILE